jgi:hypothetical protein
MIPTIDGAIIAGSISLLNTIINVYFINKQRSIQVNKDLLTNLIEQNRAKDEIIKSLKEDKQRYKKANNHLLQQLGSPVAN